MSKVKYPDKEKIRIQIDEILDKSELFDATEDKSSTYTIETSKTTPASREEYFGCSCNSGNCYICYISKELSDSWQRRAEQDKFRAVSNQQFRGRYA